MTAAKKSDPVEPDVTLSRFTDTVTLFQGQDLAALAALESQTIAAVNAAGSRRLTEGSAVKAAQEAHDALLAEAETRGLKVEIQALPGRKYRALVAECPPREGNEDDERRGYNFETLGPVLIPACSSVSEQFVDDLADGNYRKLLDRTVSANAAGSPDPKDTMSSRLGQTGGESSTPHGRLA